MDPSKMAAEAVWDNNFCLGSGTASSQEPVGKTIESTNRVGFAEPDELRLPLKRKRTRTCFVSHLTTAPPETWMSLNWVVIGDHGVVDLLSGKFMAVGSMDRETVAASSPFSRSSRFNNDFNGNSMEKTGPPMMTE